MDRVLRLTRQSCPNVVIWDDRQVICHDIFVATGGGDSDAIGLQSTLRISLSIVGLNVIRLEAGWPLHVVKVLGESLDGDHRGPLAIVAWL